MENLLTGQPVGQEYPTNYYLRVVGHLGHDNKLFDRTCPNCKGMYSSLQMNTCPKCSQALIFIKTGDGKPMAISEGTIYPSFGPKQKERDAQAIANRKNGMPSIYRFKVFSFADEAGTLAPPVGHHLLKSGSQVEITMVNHQIIPSWYLSKDDPNTPKVELMMMIYPQYGDGVKVMAGPKVAQNTTAITVDGAGHVAPVDTTSQINEIQRLEGEIARRKKEMGIREDTKVYASEADAVANDDNAPFQTEMGPVDVFNAAK